MTVRTSSLAGPGPSRESGLRPAGPVPGVTALRMLRRAKDRIDRDYAEPVGIDSLAAEAGYSLAHFIRAFRAAYGETPGAYRTRRRVERACELRSVNLSVTEICYLVGFTAWARSAAGSPSWWGSPRPPTVRKPPVAAGQHRSPAASPSCGAPASPPPTRRGNRPFHRPRFHDHRDISSETHGSVSGLSRSGRAETRTCGRGALADRA